MYAIHANIQLEQAITNDLSFAVGYIHSGGRHIPVYRNINLIPFNFLADGRPVFSRVVNASTRFDPRFNNILMVESAGVSEYNALTLQLTKRFSRGLQFSLNYTLSKATDDAPEQNLQTGNIQGLVLSDPKKTQSPQRGYGPQPNICVKTRASALPAAFTRLARRDDRPVVLRLVSVASTICQAASAAFCLAGLPRPLKRPEQSDTRPDQP